MGERNPGLSASADPFFQNAHTIILLVDPKDGSIWDANPAAVAFYGWSREEFRGRRYPDVSLDTPEAFRNQVKNVQSQGKPGIVSAHVRKDGTHRRVAAHFGPIFLHEKEVLVFFVFDIHEILQDLQLSQARLQQALSKAKDLAQQAQQANRIKTEFLANVSHEIRTPMSGVLGMLEILKETPLDEEQLHCVEIAMENGDALVRLIDDLLQFARMEAEKARLVPREISLRSLVQNFAEVLELMASKKSLGFSMQLDPDLPERVFLDGERLRQVLMNLGSNAVKFTLKGEIHFEARVLRRERSLCTVAFSFRDTGIGIAEEKLGMLFQPFSQVDSSSTREFGGTGLGLAICKKLVEAMGGKISVRSEEGSGSEFFFTLPVPLDVSSKNPGGGKKTMWIENPESYKVLVVEDNLTNQMVFTGMLQKFGLGVEKAADGSQALDLLEKTRFDLVFLDLQMPVMDGYQALREIRDPLSNVLDHQVPVVVLSAHVMRGEREKCEKMGASDFLLKPVSAKQMQESLKKWLEKTPEGEN